MGSANPAASTAPNVSTSPQPDSQTSSSNQVRVHHGSHQQQQQQPSPPRRSSSLLPTLRRRASEPLPESHRQRYTQRRTPGETHTRYTYGLKQRERRSNYTFGLAQADREEGLDEEGDTMAYRPSTRYQFGFIPHSQTLSNLNRESYDYEHTQTHTRGRVPADMRAHAALDNTHSRMPVDAQGNARSRALDAIPRVSRYAEDIRAMAGQMYGGLPTHSPRGPANRNTHRSADAYVDTHSYNYAHNRALTRQHHLRLSGGL